MEAPERASHAIRHISGSYALIAHGVLYEAVHPPYTALACMAQLAALSGYEPESRNPFKDHRDIPHHEVWLGEYRCIYALKQERTRLSIDPVCGIYMP